MAENYFKTLYDIDVRSKTKKKNNKDDLAYLSWSSCWAEVKKVYPTANFEVLKFGEIIYRMSTMMLLGIWFLQGLQ